MGDGLRITNEKQHRSSSSLAKFSLEGTHSERKLDFRVPSIPSADDQFAIAEARCVNLQDKIDLVKHLKRRKNMKKRSLTKVSEQVPETIPTISVRTQPKKKISQQPNIRMQRLEVPLNPARGYLDPATVEQHRMLGHVRRFGHNYRQPKLEDKEFSVPQAADRQRPGRSFADSGDGFVVAAHQAGQHPTTLREVASDEEQLSDDERMMNQVKPTEHPKRIPMSRRKVTSRGTREVVRPIEPREEAAAGGRRQGHAMQQPTRQLRQRNTVENRREEKPVVELYNMNRPTSPCPHELRPPGSTGNQRNRQGRSAALHGYAHFEPVPLDDFPTTVDSKKDIIRPCRRSKHRKRRYERPTVASSMKQASARYFYGHANQTNIPFVVSKSTAPSHNIGVNIQQVLNGLKVQQPLSGIPLTIAHHMGPIEELFAGLRHLPSYGSNSATASLSLDKHEINVIKLGPRLLRLPHKYMSYSRLLSLYREGDGMVPRFLRAISRPHYFYTSMYNYVPNCSSGAHYSLNTNEDYDAATSKGRGRCQEAKQSLAEYSTLYREYEQVDRNLREGKYDPELDRRKAELSRELAAREEHIRKVVQEFRAPTDGEPSLRATASNAEETCYRPSSYKLHGDN